MRNLKCGVAVLVLCATAATCGGVQTIFVDANSLFEPGDGSASEPFVRIQDAIEAAVPGDTVEIRVGVYSGEGNYDLDTGGKSIIIKSTDPADPYVVSSTVIDAGQSGRGFSFQGGEDANCVLAGLTIQNGSSGFGGAILCKNSSPTIRWCVIRSSTAISYGGGVFLWDSNSTLVECEISGNSSEAGGGLECWAGRPSLENCLIVGNTALGRETGGGGIDCYDSSAITISNCTVAGNSAEGGTGGGLLCAGSEARVVNSVFHCNRASSGAQIAAPSWFGIPASVAVYYSNIDGDREGVLVGTESVLTWGAGNIAVDPEFASFDPAGELLSWDFHLRSAYGCWDPIGERWVHDPDTSPCIDAGDPTSDWTSELWPNGERINMGAYGGTAYASLSGNPADFDMDGAVDFRDFTELALKWKQGGKDIQDLNRDGVVDRLDLSVFAANWLWRED